MYGGGAIMGTLMNQLRVLSDTAVDPVCGMTVAVGPDTPTAGGHAFCCEGCRDRWLARVG